MTDDIKIQVADVGRVGKVKVATPRKAKFRDLTDRAVIEAIWDEADRALRADWVRRGSHGRGPRMKSG